MDLASKKFVAPLALAVFLFAALFGFAAMGAHMQEGCSLIVSGAAPCPENIVAVAVHHLSAYQTFSHVPLDFGVLFLLEILLFAAFAAAVFKISPPLAAVPAYFPHGPPQSILSRQKLTRWLSLLEHSPSF
ncbi:hypothetical protein HYV30_01110 [Candidatus Kaiserbacteria bacterium]|nr:hypothetical protein [Candidatus Kaiserbacteria bacterium]